MTGEKAEPQAVVKTEVKVRYVWFNVVEGFSNSWKELPADGPLSLASFEKIIAASPDGKNWKLIEFRCLTDDSFEFTEHMQLR